MLPVELDAIRRSENLPPMQFEIPGGALEEIVQKKHHPARAPLIWQNGFFGKSKRKTVKARNSFQFKNSPLFLHPEIVDAVREYVYLPKEIIDACSSRS